MLPWRKLLIVAASLAVSAALCEVALRFWGCGGASGESQDRAFLQVNRYWGMWHFPQNSVRHRKICFDVRYDTNDLGMKDDPVRDDARKIALLGDSFVEGFGNDNRTTLSAFMERSLGGAYDVLNLGVSGDFSTVDQLVLYDDLARFFRPEIVVLLFVNYNDLHNALQPAKRELIDEQLRFVYPKVGSFEEIASYLQSLAAPPPASPIGPRGLCLSRLLNVVEKLFRDQLQMRLNVMWDFRRELARVYSTRPDEQMEKAWGIVEASLAELGRLTRRDGSRLVVVDLADPYQIDANWMAVSSAAVGETLDPIQPNQRLAEICRRHGIRFYDMYGDAKRIIVERSMRFPYLSFRCDRHYAPEGQRLAADLITAYLRAEKLVPE